MALMLGVSKRTIENRMAEYELTNKSRYSDIEDDFLDSLIQRIILHIRNTLCPLNREFKKERQVALTSLLCDRVLEIKTLISVDRLQNNRGLPCFARCTCAEVETKECHKESRSHRQEAKVYECHP